MKRILQSCVNLACLVSLWGGPALAGQSDCPKGREGLQCRAEAGDARAQFEWGMEMVMGRVPGASHLTALVWFDKAAKQGHQEAESMIARMSLSTEPGGSCGK